jgi:Glycosyl transferase family 2
MNVAAEASAHHALKLTKFKTGVSLLCWGYNEEALIEGFLSRALELLESIAEDFEIVFVDDGSIDRTAEIADKVAVRDRRVRVIRHGVNKNVGAAVRSAIANAEKEVFFWQTVDWSYDITQARIFLELTRYYDVVHGIRPIPIRLMSYIPVVRSIYRVRTRSDNLQKAIISLGNYYALRILYGVAYYDFQNVTFYNTKKLQSFDLKGDSAFVAPECLIRAYAGGQRVIEVPIPFIPRSAGQGKGTNLNAIVRAVRDICVNWVRWGWRIRLEQCKPGRQPIHRVFMPFPIDDAALPLILPLLPYFR